jgi:hypothetical protein
LRAVAAGQACGALMALVCYYYNNRCLMMMCIEKKNVEKQIQF